MRQEDNLKEKAGKGIPFKVPDNYFVTFKEDLMAKLPEYPEKPVEKKLSAWQRMKPYIYLAAMFAGIWCMMKIFHTVSSQPGAPVSAVDEDFIAANYEPDSYDLYISESNGIDFELEDEIAELYPSIEEFKKDFYGMQVD